MAGLLSSWWSGKPSEEKATEEKTTEGQEKEAVSEDGGQEKQKSSEDALSWVSGLEGLVKNVTEYAATVGESVKARVQETPVSFMNKFQEEQDKFTRERRRLRDAAVPPWVGYNEEEQMKAQILELSADSRNVLRNPPPGVQFNFDFTKSYPVAMAMLKEDVRLQKLRFELVPKKICEQKFWHNFFYRVFLIKQSSQLSSLASDQRESVSSAGRGETGETGEGGVEAVQSPGQEEFASDALTTDGAEINRETIQAELGQLGVSSGEKEGGEEGGENIPTSVWEEQLEQELNDLDLQGLVGVAGGEGGGEEGVEEDPEVWESEIQQMLDMHSDPPTQN